MSRTGLRHCGLRQAVRHLGRVQFRQNLADQSPIVAARGPDPGMKLKRLRRKGESIALEAANPAYETRLYRAGKVKIQGKMVGLIRTYR